VDDTLDNGAWLSLAEAARALGVSEKTARRRAKAGQLQARQVGTQHGPAWQVWVPNGVDVEGRVDGTGTQAATMLELVRLVGELQGKAESAAMWQGRAELLALRLAAAEEKLKALEAPAAPELAPAPEPAPPTTDGREPHWLARLTAWLAAG
jgi:hypothetical protein